MRVLGLLLAFLVVAPVQAAVFTVKEAGGITAVILSGKINPGDQDIFAAKVGNAKNVAVILNSGGGDVIAGLGIAKLVHARHYETGVFAGSSCASMCAAIWLGGETRSMAPSSRVGFHSAWRMVNGQMHQASSGNALIGAYYGSLGLPDKAIIYLTEIEPDSIRWLSFQDARTYGISFHELADEMPPETPRVAGKPAVVSAPPSSTEVETSGLTPSEEATVGRLARNFSKEYARGGQDRINTAIMTCYAQARYGKAMDVATYCAALDVLAFLVDKAALDKLGQKYTPDRTNAPTRVNDRTAAIADFIGVNSTSLQNHAATIGQRAFKMIGAPTQAVASSPSQATPEREAYCSIKADELRLSGASRDRFNATCRNG